MTVSQIILTPDQTFPDADVSGDARATALAAYSTAKWCWKFNGKTSGWFDTRDAAIADAETQYPGTPIG